MILCARIGILLVPLLSLTLSTALGQVPQMIAYQGRATVSGTNFNGAGQFKFALVGGFGTKTYWSNNGSSSGGGQPSAAIPLQVTQGLFSVLLGDPYVSGMRAIPPTVFTNTDVALRIWLSEGSSTFQLLTPDQRIGSVGYAMISD